VIENLRVRGGSVEGRSRFHHNPQHVIAAALR
jgi:hypothetical protein